MMILVLDDHRNTADVLCRLLVREGHNPVAVYSVAEATAICKCIRFDLMFCDVDLPGENGREMLQIAMHYSTPVVAVTGHDDMLDATQTFNGYAAYLRKPISFATINSIINKFRSQQLMPVN